MVFSLSGNSFGKLKPLHAGRFHLNQDLNDAFGKICERFIASDFFGVGGGVGGVGGGVGGVGVVGGVGGVGGGSRIFLGRLALAFVRRIAQCLNVLRIFMNRR